MAVQDLLIECRKEYYEIDQLLLVDIDHLNHEKLKQGGVTRAGQVRRAFNILVTQLPLNFCLALLHVKTLVLLHDAQHMKHETLSRLLTLAQHLVTLTALEQAHSVQLAS